MLGRVADHDRLSGERSLGELGAHEVPQPVRTGQARNVVPVPATSDHRLIGRLIDLRKHTL